MDLKTLANQISNEMLKGTTPPPADPFDPDKYPFGSAPGTSKFGNMTCPTCGKPPTDTPRGPAFLFKDYESAKEYKISGMCQSCQDGVFDAPL